MNICSLHGLVFILLSMKLLQHNEKIMRIQQYHKEGLPSECLGRSSVFLTMSIHAFVLRWPHCQHADYAGPYFDRNTIRPFASDYSEKDVL